MTLERYRSVVREWDRFIEANHSPEPVTLRVRSSLVSEAELAARLARAGFRVEPVPGLDSYLRVRENSGSVAQTTDHWLGFFHVQQAVMALPSLALGAVAGERVLDLCSAPGGKTTHLSELMQETGPLVAVEPKEKRIRGLLGNVYRLGYRNVIVVGADGRSLPEGTDFDRVLVDAPCSGEGNQRRKEDHPPRWTPEFSAYVTRVQEALLRRAIHLTRPGGTIVYSTCTYAPEENEAVVDQVVRDAPVTIEEVPLDFPHEPGLTRWAGKRFHRDVAKTWRVYPHHMDSGGLYMARLRRHDTPTPNAGAPGWERVPAAFPGESTEKAGRRIEGARSELVGRFGFDLGLPDKMGWIVRGKHIWSHSAGIWPSAQWCESAKGRARIVSVGLRAFRGEQGWRETPSSHFLRRWASQIGESRRVQVNTSELQSLLRGGSLPPTDLPAGPFALVWGGRVLGRGMVGSRGLVHELGRARAERLLAILRERADGVAGAPAPDAAH